MNRNIQTVIKSGVKRRFGISNKLVCAKVQAGVTHQSTGYLFLHRVLCENSKFLLQKTPIPFDRRLLGRSGPYKTPGNKKINRHKKEDPQDPSMDLNLGRVMLAAGGGLAPFPAPHSAPRGRDSQGFKGGLVPFHGLRRVCGWAFLQKNRARKCEMRNRAERANGGLS